MNLLQKLVQGIRSAEHTIGAGFQPTDVAHTIAPGHKFSPAVEAQNRAPLPTTNQYNAQGLPTYEILNNMPNISTLYAPAPRPAVQLRTMGNLYNPMENKPMQAHPLSYGHGMQGFVNSGYTPLQVGGYANRMQNAGSFNQQAPQVGVTSYGMRGLLQ